LVSRGRVLFKARRSERATSRDPRGVGSPPTAVLTSRTQGARRPTSLIYSQHPAPMHRHLPRSSHHATGCIPKRHSTRAPRGPFTRTTPHARWSTSSKTRLTPLLGKHTLPLSERHARRHATHPGAFGRHAAPDVNHTLRSRRHEKRRRAHALGPPRAPSARGSPPKDACKRTLM
jgi:hypothetical protein